LPIRKLSLGLILTLGCAAHAGVAWGQNGAQGAQPSAATGSAPAGRAQQQGQAALDQAARELQELSQAQARTQTQSETQTQTQPEPKTGDAKEIERLKAQLELQQKQIEALLKMTQLLAEQVKKQAGTGAAVEKLEEQAAAQETSIQQGAQRDKELAQAHDAIVEQVDAATRTDPTLPPTVRELFSPFRNNESPLSIYGTVAQNFAAYSQQPSTFRDQTLELRPYLLLNEHFLMSANVALQIGTVMLYRAQVEWFLNDNWTFVAGRFYSPIGFYSERLRLNWVIKTPDPPLLFNQVYPNLLSFDGVQLRGARYVPSTPVKLEYTGFIANGLSLPGSGKLSPLIYSNLNNFTDNINDVTSAKAYGGRVGISIPDIGFIAGLSGLQNNAYATTGQDLRMWDVDANFHRGNWDMRFELVHTDQATPPPAQPIHRSGLYGQVAYRPYNSTNPYFQKMEGVLRFDHVQIDGIDLKVTGINFGGNGMTYNRQPLSRNRYTIGANYWFYPSLALKLAYEIYDELGIPSLRDNGFLGQIVWGF
jgi:hypothetical protein